jgi:hypothetical protein
MIGLRRHPLPKAYDGDEAGEVEFVLVDGAPLFGSLSFLSRWSPPCPGMRDPRTVSTESVLAK